MREEEGHLRQKRCEEIHFKVNLLELASSKIIDPLNKSSKYTYKIKILVIINKFLLKHSRHQFIKINDFVEVFLIRCHYFINNKVMPRETITYSVIPA